MLPGYNTINCMRSVVFSNYGGQYIYISRHIKVLIFKIFHSHGSIYSFKSKNIFVLTNRIYTFTENFWTNHICLLRFVIYEG